jgi:hypothetical protein
MERGAPEHIIDKIRVEVRAGRREAALQVQEQLGFYLHSHGFAGELESLLDRLVPQDVYLEMPDLELTVNVEKGAAFGALLFTALEAAIRAKLTASRAPGEVLLKGAALAEAVRDSFMLFGFQPYAAAGAEPLVGFIQALRALPEQADVKLEAWLLQLGRRSAVVWRRLFFIVGASGMRQLMLRLLALDETVLLSIWREMSGGGDVASLLLVDARGWGILVPAAMSAKDRGDGGSGVVQANTPGVVVRKEFPGADRRRLPGRVDEQYERQLRQGIAVGNAGLTIVWRAYGVLLKKLGWVSDGGDGAPRVGFVDDAARQRAVWLLDYLVWGNGAAVDALAEERLPLNKVLCGWPLEEPVDPACYPDAAALAEADTMLAGWLVDWKKDRVLSVAWLRVAFLQRAGALSRRLDESWQLTVEKRMEDVLIDRPSVIRYPWMERLLFVEW